jgi:hypothetical protein
MARINYCVVLLIKTKLPKTRTKSPTFIYIFSKIRKEFLVCAKRSNFGV